uniref:CIP2A N-terminal domain-containing protein n=1 Tax=Xiphophorus couchianus TaxID=32473 RepID=A0A3B5MNL7_9TELE
MDIATCLKSLLVAIQQYRDSRTVQHTAQLQKQVEELSGLKCDGLLSSGQFLPTECVSGLVELAGNPSTSPALTNAIISLLAQLGSDDASREVLHSSYNLTSTLAAVIHHHGNTPGDPLVLQVETNVFGRKRKTTHCTFGFLMCVKCVFLKLIFTVKENVRQLYRTLINFLAHNSLTVVIFTLSILASLTLNEKVGQKLFEAKNIHQTFQLVFNIIVNGGGTLTRKYSVDLLVDLLKSPKVADYLSRYQHFSACVSQVLGLLHLKDADSAATVLQLLLSMCSVAALRSQLCKVVFRPAGAKLRAAGHGQTGEANGGRKAECGLALVQWLTSPVEGAEKCSLQTLQLLTELLEESLGAESVSGSTLNFVEMLLPVALGLLKGLDPAKGDAHLRKHCHRITHVCTLLLNILTHRPACVQLCAEALLKVLELMSRLRQQVKDMETSFYRMLQDQRTVTPLSLALTSHHRERVQTGLTLLLEATPLPDFPALLLGESIAANNAYRQREAELTAKRVAVQEVPPPWMNSSTMDASSGNKSVSSLVEKLQTGMELQEPTKDSPLSEIIDVYEQKLAGFASKESRLQDLLEAKALALSQADRLIAQYRLQRAQAEARKLACLLKDAERRREDLQGELGNQVLEVERSRADMEELLQHNAQLQRDSEEHQTLKGAYNALLNRSERLLKELQAAHISLSKQNDTLRKNHEALQLITSELQEREAEIKSLRLDVEKKNSDVAGQEKDQERRDLEETLDVLRKELNKTEQARKDVSIKASSLELQKSQLESKLKQKEDELNKHSAMIAMIHSLSSGKLKSDVNLSL